MTPEESRLRAVESQLEENSCHCAATPELHYEPGVSVIRCPRGCLQAVKPDFQPEAAFDEWLFKLNQPIKK